MFIDIIETTVGKEEENLIVMADENKLAQVSYCYLILLLFRISHSDTSY